jgi:tight adherence protein C
MLLTVAVLALGLAAFLGVEVASEPRRRQHTALQRAAGYGRRRRDRPAEETKRFAERVVVPLVGRLAALTLRLNPRTSVEAIGMRLLAAGLAGRVSATQFLALKAGLAVGAVAVGIALAASVSPTLGLLLTPLVAAIGFRLPELLLAQRTARRRDRIRAVLPDALDLLAVSVEAGLGLDGAIAKLTEHMEGALVDEFAITLGEMRVGEARHDALKKLADRVPAPEVAAFVRSVIQADQLGISLGRILRVQAADSRQRRQAAAEERAMKAPIKMLFPTALFIFPSMFVVILGPALISITHVFTLR